MQGHRVLEMMSSQFMTTMCPLDQIRPNYLFIHVSTMWDDKRSGSVLTCDMYLRSYINGSEGGKGFVE